VDLINYGRFATSRIELGQGGDKKKAGTWNKKLGGTTYGLCRESPAFFYTTL